MESPPFASYREELSALRPGRRKWVGAHAYLLVLTGIAFLYRKDMDARHKAGHVAAIQLKRTGQP
jgi:hypothetical protein